MSVTQPDRRVVTFYSFKGGVGRTMALANVAYRMADSHGLNVIVVDWDLEAPGLHKYFGIDDTQMAKASGVLDYFIAWREAFEQNAPEPPDAKPWLIPIVDDDHRPCFGSIKLLVAARIDEAYDGRLANFDWKALYSTRAGAVAVETLRKQLLECADLILIDSRTGYTDSGGPCTIQLPDALVMMAAPNQQAIEGLEPVAKVVTTADEEDRAGRARAKIWLSIGRVPSVDESYLADKWFEDHKPWFERTLKDGLWRHEDHLEGLRTYEIPHRGRWSFGEQLIRKGKPYVDAHDPLAEAYDRIARTIFRWSSGDLIETSSTSLMAHAQDIIVFKRWAEDAERRGDMPGLTDALSKLGRLQHALNSHDEAIRTLERAADIALGNGDRRLSAEIDLSLADALQARGDGTQALERAQRSALVFRSLGAEGAEAQALLTLGRLHRGQDQNKQALEFIGQSKERFTIIGDRHGIERALNEAGICHLNLNQWPDAERHFRESIATARSIGDRMHEKSVLDLLLKSAPADHPLPDAEALRARADELRAKLALTSRS